MAIGQQLVILTRGIDLSVGANLALATVIGGLVFREVDSAPLVVLAMVAAGATVGAVNGLVYVFGRLPHPFIITLATLSICRGLALELAVGHTTMRGMPEAIATARRILGARASELLLRRARASRLPLLVMTKAMVWGRWIYAVGGEPKAARRDGHPGQGGAGLDLRHLRSLRRHRRRRARRPDRRGLAALRQPARTRHASPR